QEGAELEAPGGRGDDGHVVVDEQVVQAGRRDRPAECLERQPVVARRELQLLETDLARLAERHARTLPQGTRRSRRSKRRAPAESTTAVPSTTTSTPLQLRPSSRGGVPTSQTDDTKRNGASHPARPCRPLIR